MVGVWRAETLEVFERWSPRLAGWRLALACQDGQENLPLPWDAIDAVFIGGSTNWKGSAAVVQIIQAAQLLGKHVHVGRVNGAEAGGSIFEELGADTCDGTGISQYSVWREAIGDRHTQGDIFCMNRYELEGDHALSGLIAIALTAINLCSSPAA